MTAVRFFWMLVATCFSLSAGAQTPDSAPEPNASETASERSIFGTPVGKGVQVAPIVRVTGFDGMGAVMLGGRVGWVFHHALSLGFEGHGLASPTVWHPDKQQVLSMSYQGLFADVTFGSSQMIQGTAHAFMGFGEAHYRSSEDRSNLSEVTDLWVMELGASLNYQPFSWLRVQGGPGMRIAPGGELSAISGKGFWGPYGEISVAFGWL